MSVGGHTTLAVVFDFDDSLAPDSTSGLLAGLGVDVRRFWRDEVDPLLAQDWDPVLAYLWRLVGLRDAAGRPLITRDRMTDWGRSLSLYPGATRIFSRLRSVVARVEPRLAIEFYIVSSGLGEVVRNTRVAKEFSDIWASEFHYGPTGDPEFPRKVISFTDKTRYLFQIVKGMTGEPARRDPFKVNERVPPAAQRIPFRNIVVVGDGYTDIPCFSLVRNNGGVAVAVYDADNREKWGRAWGFIEDDRVSALVPADYRQGAALTTTLSMAVQRIAERITHEP